MSLRKRATKSNLKTPSTDYFNQQVAASDSRQTSNFDQLAATPILDPLLTSPVDVSYTPSVHSQHSFLTGLPTSASPVSIKYASASPVPTIPPLSLGDQTEFAAEPLDISYQIPSASPGSPTPVTADSFNISYKTPSPIACAPSRSNDSSVSYQIPSALAHSPVSVPVKTSTYDEEEDLLPEMPRPPFSHAQEDSFPPPKRAKLGYTDREAAEAESSNDTEVDDSPTTNKLTMIGSSVLAKLRDDKTQLLAANGELAKDNVKLKKKLADEEKMMAENDVLKVEIKALENSLEKEQAENEELQVELSKLRAEKIQMQGTIDYYAGQDGELRQQLQHGQREYAQLQRDYEDLVAAYNELNARVRAAGAPGSPEPEFDLAEGFPRYE